MRTDEEIATEVAALKAIRVKVPPHGFMGDNHAAIDLQIEVLEKKWSHDRVFDELGDESADEFDQNLLDEAMNARNWLAGTASEPSIDWADLVR